MKTDGTVKSGFWEDDEYIGESKNTGQTTGCITGDCEDGFGSHLDFFK